MKLSNLFLFKNNIDFQVSTDLFETFPEQEKLLSKIQKMEHEK